MLKVIIADDEARVCSLIQMLIDWQELNMELAGTASNGLQALELIQTCSPDILITDIRMPGADGLTMLAALRSEFPDMQVTVLTGYQDFSYAQQAIRLGVTRFLLKPSKMDEIREALETMTVRLNTRSQMRHPEEEPEEEQHGAGSFIVNQAMAYIEEHYAEKLTLQGVADCCYVSQWHLSKLLNRHTGKSFYDILNTVRIRKAKELLLDPRLKIGEIGERVGYADTAHFARTFKKQEGMSANEYRNTLK